MDIEKEKLEKCCRRCAYVLFVSAALVAVWAFMPLCLPLICTAYWMAVCGYAFLEMAHLIRRVIDLEHTNGFKEAIIRRMEEQRHDMHREIEQLTEECKAAKAGKEGPDAPVENPGPSIPTLLDKLQVRITATPDKVALAVDRNLYIQPKEEGRHWWKLRGYDTDLTDPDREYYIYIRLAFKGTDGEVRFLKKADLKQNDNHRFLQVGTISPVADGKRIVRYTLDAFRFKRV